MEGFTAPKSRGCSSPYSNHFKDIYLSLFIEIFLIWAFAVILFVLGWLVSLPSFIDHKLPENSRLFVSLGLIDFILLRAVDLYQNPGIPVTFLQKYFRNLLIFRKWINMHFHKNPSEKMSKEKITSTFDIFKAIFIYNVVFISKVLLIYEGVFIF